MKISSIQLEEIEGGQSDVHEGLRPFSNIPLSSVVVLAGSNGSGKTRLLKLLERHVANLRSGAGILGLKVKISQGENERVLGPENVSEMEQSSSVLSKSTLLRSISKYQRTKRDIFGCSANC